MPRSRTPKRKPGRVMKPKSKKSSKSRNSNKSSSINDSGVLGYCLKCREKKAFEKNYQIVTMKNGRKAKKGKCSDPNCDTTMFRIL